MTYYQTEPQFNHRQGECLGVLMLNLGTPEAPAAPALKTYLREFLWDRRIVDLPRPLWWLILNGIILNTRPKKSAAAYQKIWTDQGSPLYTGSLALVNKVQAGCSNHYPFPVRVELAMRYGQPGVAQALQRLKQGGARHLLILPMYPQYSSTTTASTFDAVVDELKRWRWIPELRFINQYHDHPLYIKALADSIISSRGRADVPEKLLFSFHGMPQRYFLAGDPYFCQCHKTARLVAEHLGLAEEQWQVSFQSLFGKEEWLQPYTAPLVEQWGRRGTGRLEVICPGFSVDCLETLEEIDQELRRTYLDAGGRAFDYVPALNDLDSHVQLMMALIDEHIRAWGCARQDYPGYDVSQLQARQQRMESLRSQQGAGDD